MTALPPIPEALFDLMAEVGPLWGTDITGHTKLMVNAFSEILQQAPKEGQVTKDIAYGAHARQILDVYQPRRAVGAPVVVFAHGGAFVDGVKDRTPEVYANVGWYLARNGVICVNTEYRLAPEFKYPSASEDIALATAWVADHIEGFGGDPSRTFMMGHSAGAAHVGLYAYSPRFGEIRERRVRGLIVISGRVRAENGRDNPNARKVEAYYGTDPAVMEEGSVCAHVTRSSVPTLIALAEYENPLIDVHCAELFHRLAQAQRRAPRILRLGGFTHTASIAHLNTAEERLGREILDFIRQPV